MSTLPPEIFAQIIKNFQFCDPETGTPHGRRTLYSLLQTSHLTYDLAFPVLYSSLYFDCSAFLLEKLKNHSRKEDIYRHVRRAKINIRRRENKITRELVCVMDQMINLQRLVIYFSEGPAVSTFGDLFKITFSRLKELLILDLTSVMLDVGWIGMQELTTVRLLELGDITSFREFSLPPNLGTFIFHGYCLGKPRDPPTLNLASLTTLHIRLSTLADYLREYPKRSVFDVFPSSLTHLYLKCYDGPYEVPEEDTEIFLPILSQLHLIHLQIQFFVFFRAYDVNEDLALDWTESTYDLEGWRAFLPKSLKSWDIICKDVRSEIRHKQKRQLQQSAQFARILRDMLRNGEAKGSEDLIGIDVIAEWRFAKMNGLAFRWEGEQFQCTNQWRQ